MSVEWIIANHVLQIKFTKTQKKYRPTVIMKTHWHLCNKASTILQYAPSESNKIGHAAYMVMCRRDKSLRPSNSIPVSWSTCVQKIINIFAATNNKRFEKGMQVSGILHSVMQHLAPPCYTQHIIHYLNSFSIKQPLDVLGFSLESDQNATWCVLVLATNGRELTKLTANTGVPSSRPHTLCNQPHCESCTCELSSQLFSPDTVLFGW